MLKSSGDFLIIFVSWCDEGLVVDVGEAEFCVELQLLTVGEFQLVAVAVALNLENLRAREQFVDFRLNLFRDKICWNRIAFHLSPIAVVVELQLGAVGENHVIAADEQACILLGNHNFLRSEILLYEHLRRLRQLCSVDNLVVVGLCHSEYCNQCN